MRYLTVRETAERWGVTQRQAQRLLAAGRVDGATRHGRAWMIPDDARKPEDPRRARAERARLPDEALPIVTRPRPTIVPAYSSRFPYALLCDELRLNSGSADEALDRVQRSDARAQVMAELAYMRGDFQGAINFLRNSRSGDPLRFSSLFILSMAYISLGDIRRYENLQDEIALLQRSCLGDESALRAVELLRASLDVALNSPHSCVDWLKDGDLNLIPAAFRPFTVFTYAKYLQSIGQYERMLAVCETALLLIRRDTYTFTELYLYLMCVSAFWHLGRTEAARTALHTALGLALPDGFVTPFVENLAPIRELMESTLRLEFPNYVAVMLAQYRRVEQSWHKMRSQHMRDQLSRILTPREHQIVALFAQGANDDEIARRFSLSVSRVRSTLQSAREKLGVRSRSALKKLLKP